MSVSQIYLHLGEYKMIEWKVRQQELNYTINKYPLGKLLQSPSLYGPVNIWTLLLLHELLDSTKMTNKLLRKLLKEEKEDGKGTE